MTRLDEIAGAIEKGDKVLARELIREEIRENPSADAWYLAARVVSSPEQAKKFLEKALDLDPFHQKTHALLAWIQKGTTQQNSTASRGFIAGQVGPIPLPIMQDQPRASNLLNQALMIFGNNQWDVKYSTPEMVQFEKKRGINTGGAVLIILLLGFLGSLIVILGIATSSIERITFQATPGGALIGTTQKQQGHFQTVEDLTKYAESVKTGTTSYAGAIALGLISMICYLMIFSY